MWASDTRSTLTLFLIQEVTLMLWHGHEPGGRSLHLKPLLITALVQCQQNGRNRIKLPLIRRGSVDIVNLVATPDKKPKLPSFVVLRTSSGSVKLDGNKLCAFINELNSVIVGFCFDNSQWWCICSHYAKKLDDTSGVLFTKWEKCQKFLTSQTGIYKSDPDFSQPSAHNYGLNKTWWMWNDWVWMSALCTHPLNKPDSPVDSGTATPPDNLNINLLWGFTENTDIPDVQTQSDEPVEAQPAMLIKNLWRSGRRRANFSKPETAVTASSN